MNKVINLFFISFLLLGLTACGGSGDNTSVKEIVNIINNATQMEQRIAEEEASGQRQFGELHDGEVFITPNGNIFANEEILALINANPKYKLNDTDKEMLTTAVEQYFGAGAPESNSTLAGAYADGLNSAGLSIAKEAINRAKTLHDLYKIALSKEII